MRRIALVLAAAVALGAAAFSGMELRLKRAGYVDVATAVPGVQVDLMYARPDNFTGRVLYDSLHHAFLHPDAARALGRAQKELTRLAPGTFLMVKDAARPVAVHRSMFRSVRGRP